MNLDDKIRSSPERKLRFESRAKRIVREKFGRQSRKASLFESVTNVVIGLAINVIAQHYIFPLVGIHITIAENIALAVLFTIISICRSYILRRCFEYIRVQGITCANLLAVLPGIQKSINSIMKGFSVR